MSHRISTSRFLREERTKSSGGKVALHIAGALSLFVISFFVALKLIDYSNLWEFNPLDQPTVDIAKLPKLAPGQSLNLSDGKNRSALISGWSYSEPGGTWTERHSAFLAFVINGTEDTPLRDVKLRSTVFVAPPAVLEQRVQVWSASNKLADFAIEQSHADLLIPLSRFRFHDGTPLVLGFYLPNAIAPDTVHIGKDSRLLALKVESVQLE